MILLDLIKIDIALALVLFLPGYALLIALTRNKNPLGIVGTLLTSLVLSIGVVNFSLILVDKAGFKLTPLSIISTLLILSGLGLFFYYKFKKEEKLISKSKQNWLVFLLISALAIFIRLVYLAPKIVPHTTDLGHHMYWVNYIIKFQELPIYGIPDVIIGEHLIFGAISIISGIGTISALPGVILFLINFFSLLAIFLLTQEIAKCFFKNKASYQIALFSLIAIGVFYTIKSPQTSYVNGGVIGNLMGGLFLPMIFYLFLKALRKNSALYASLGVFLIGNLAYIHHLSSFILIYSLLGFFLMTGLLLILTKTFKPKIDLEIKSFLKIFFNLKTILTGFLILVWFFLLRLPSYLNVSAIDTAVGNPSKSTRVGLTLNNLMDSTGSWRFFYAVIGLLFLGFLFWTIIKKNPRVYKNYQIKKVRFLEASIGFSLASGWFLTIFLMSYRPDLLKIDIISGRIANYLVYPAAILAGFGVFALLKPVLNKNKSLALVIMAFVFIPGVMSGLTDLSESYLEKKEKFDKTVETFRASEYLNAVVPEEDRILKDHIYLTGDTWVKNFLMRGYEEPLSRSYLKRYDPINNRETCTRDMIAIPESEIGKQCFEETGVRFIILRNSYDTHKFEKSENFSKLFHTREVVIFERNQNE
jgi:hypothetical protein